MVGQQFGRGRHRLGKLCLQPLEDALMRLPAHAPEHRLVGGLLHQSMLKRVDGPRRLPALIQQLRRD